MGTILSSKILPDDKVKLKICLDEEEALSLRGCVKDINIFASDLCTIESRVIERGKDGVTKHFLIPSQLRSRTKKQIFGMKCQRIDSENKIMFIYTIDNEGNILLD